MIENTKQTYWWLVQYAWYEVACSIMQQLTPIVHMMWGSVLHCAANNPYSTHDMG